MLQHSNVDLWLMQVPEASGASARPISRRPRCHTCGREVAPREARHTRCGHVVHRDSEGCECKRVHCRNCAEWLRPQPGPEPLPNHLQAHESSEQSGLSGGAFQSDGSYVGNGAARLASIGAARQAAVASTVSSQAHETSPASGPLKVEVPAAPRFVDAYVSTDEFRVPQAGQEVFAAYFDTEEERVTSLRAIERLPCFLAQCIGSRLVSEAYDNAEDHHAEANRLAEDQMSECSNDLLRAPLTRTGIFTNTGSERCYGIFAISWHRISLQKAQSYGGGSSAAESLAAQGDFLLHPPGVWAGAFLGCLRVGSCWEPRLLTG